MGKRIVYTIVILLFMAGCAQKEAVEKISLAQPKESPAISKEEKIPVAIGSMLSPKETYIYYKQLMDYIGKKIQKPIELIQRDSYQEVNDLLKQGKIKIAFVCSSPYCILHDEIGMELLAVPEVSGKKTYRSYIIIRRDSPVKSLEELEGRSFAFSDPLSNSGYLAPRYMIHKMGKNSDKFFKKQLFSGSHDNSIKFVAERFVDAAGVDSLIWEYYNKVNPEFTSLTRILAKSEEFGMPPVVVQKDFDNEFKEKIRKILLDMDREPEGKEILDKLLIDRFILGSDKDYDSIRQMEEILNKESQVK